MNIPHETPTMVMISAILIVAMMFYVLFGNVHKNQRRRLLQNFVYRAYQALTWCSSLVRGFDAAVSEYYRTMEKTKIVPLNEKRYPAICETECTPRSSPIEDDEQKSAIGHMYRKLAGR